MNSTVYCLLIVINFDCNCVIIYFMIKVIIITNDMLMFE
jgi:hypothetical protein